MGSGTNSLHEAVFEALPCELIVHDGERVALANAAACHAFGAASPRSLVGLPLAALVHPKDGTSADQRSTLVTGQERPFAPMALCFTELSGDSFAVEATVRGFSVGARRFAVLARELACPTIVEPTEDFPHFAEATSLALAALDALLQPVTAYDSDDTIVFSNQAAARLFGSARSSGLAGQPLSALIHSHTREAARQRRRLVLEHGQTFPRVDAKLRRLDGETIHATGSLGGLRLPGGARLGYWMGHSFSDTSPVTQA